MRRTRTARRRSSCDSWHCGGNADRTTCRGALASFLQSGPDSCAALGVRAAVRSGRRSHAQRAAESEVCAVRGVRPGDRHHLVPHVRARADWPASASASASRPPASSVLECVGPSAAGRSPVPGSGRSTAWSGSSRRRPAPGPGSSATSPTRESSGPSTRSSRPDAAPVRVDDSRRRGPAGAGRSRACRAPGRCRGGPAPPTRVNAAIAARWCATASSSRPASCSTMPRPAVACAQSRSSRGPAPRAAGAARRRASPRRRAAAAPQGVAEVDQHRRLQVVASGPVQHVQRAAVRDDGGRRVVGAVQHVPEPVVGVREHEHRGVVRVDGRLQQRDRLAVQLQGRREPARGVEHLPERAGQPALHRGTAAAPPAPCSRSAARSTCSAAG